LDEGKMRLIEFSGRWSYRIRSLWVLFTSGITVIVRRLLRGPYLPGWSFYFELATRFLKRQTKIAFSLPTAADAREYGDAIVLNFPCEIKKLRKVRIEPAGGPPKGLWYTPISGTRDLTILYLHGGGFAFYATAHRNLIASVALAGPARTFALDYRLAPENPFPAQLEDSIAAYRWLVEAQSVDPRKLVVMGDSAGGTLVLELLLAIRDDPKLDLSQPALAICFAPWGDLTNSGQSMTSNAASDWISREMLEQCVRWLGNVDRSDPRASPFQADPAGLPPIFIQTGSVEILRDQILEFGAKAGADAVVVEVIENMNHVFQAHGDMIEQSRKAMARVREVIDAHVMS
jgi:acetyl esterase/lipase